METLIVLDFAGTLSIETVLFGREDRLRRALIQSGLAALGYQEPKRFWEELMIPTWEEGARSSIGYAGVLLNQIKAHPIKEIEKAVNSFVTRYLRHSRIHPAWRPLFERTRNSSDVQILIATDHYAELTGHLRQELRSWRISLQPLRKTNLQKLADQEVHDSFPQKRHSMFLVNSADVGALKSEPLFWETVAEQILLSRFSRILLIDDFGFNEHPGDPYRAQGKVEQRRNTVTRLLSKAGGKSLEVFPFFLENVTLEDPPCKIHQSFEALIQQALVLCQSA
jgi:hypothetical protein